MGDKRKGFGRAKQVLLGFPLPHYDGLAGVGAFQSGEAEFKAPEVLAGGVYGFAVFFDGAEELAHGSLEAGIEP